MKQFVDKLQSGIRQLGITLSQEQAECFFHYYQLLAEWNKIMNLTAIIEMDDVIEKHFVDSLTLVYALGSLNGKNLSLIDVGTGAGFPGIPLKIAYPSLNVVLVDSVNKRVKFLNAVIAKLKLVKIQVVHGRAELLGQKESCREKYDLCVSRAVANIATLSEYCLPFVKTGGKFISYKSGKVDEELSVGKKAIQILGGRIADVKKFSLGSKCGKRSLVIIDKVSQTPKKYPRRAGIPSREPVV